MNDIENSTAIEWKPRPLKYVALALWEASLGEFMAHVTGSAGSANVRWDVQVTRGWAGASGVERREFGTIAEAKAWAQEQLTVLARSAA